MNSLKKKMQSQEEERKSNSTIFSHLKHQIETVKRNQLVEMSKESQSCTLYTLCTQIRIMMKSEWVENFTLKR